MNQYKPYAEYKDSGVEWLGHVPAHWNLLKVARDINYTVGWTPSTANAENFGDEFPWVTIADMQSEYITTTSSTLSLKAVRDKNARPIPTGSLLFSFKLSVGKVAFTQFPVFTNEAIAAFTENRRVSLRLLYYAAPIFIPQSGRTNVYNSLLLNQELIGEAKTFLPPLPEQHAIATFLDRETAKIDALIEKKSKFIELLEEKRQAFISHAVTKGLNPDAPLKDSGVPWLGEVPAHWEVRQLKYTVSKTGSGTTPAKDDDYVESGGIPWVTTSELRETTIVQTRKQVSHNAQRTYAPLVIHPKRSLLIAMYGATVGRLGRLGIAATSNQACFAIHPDQTNSIDYLELWFRAYRHEIILLSVGAGQPNISGGIIRNLVVPIPPAEERQTIITIVNKAVHAITETQNHVSHSITLLREKRSALITAAVTGQIDVRDEVAV